MCIATNSFVQMVPNSNPPQFTGPTRLFYNEFSDVMGRFGKWVLYFILIFSLRIAFPLQVSLTSPRTATASALNRLEEEKPTLGWFGNRIQCPMTQMCPNGCYFGRTKWPFWVHLRSKLPPPSLPISWYSMTQPLHCSSWPPLQLPFFFLEK